MQQRKAVVGSESALKIRATESAFKMLAIDANVVACKAKSGVDSQPVGMEMMEEGATNRALSSIDQHRGGEFYIGIENGMVIEGGTYFDVPCIVVFHYPTAAGPAERGLAFGAFFPIPDWVAQEVLSEKAELGPIVQRLAGGGEKDPMKYFSKGLISREQILTQAIACALVDVIHMDLYS